VPKIGSDLLALVGPCMHRDEIINRAAPFLH
jgi:hypothetical protein